jgi:ribulose-phosphate 3-epimerase
MNISTSLICCDLSNISKDLDIIVEHDGFNWLHADFMDGHFVPRYGISPELIQALRKRYGNRVFIDSHMMVADPYTYADVIAPYSDWYFFHYEAVTDPVRTLQMLRKKYPTLKIGVTFNLFTPDCVIEQIARLHEGLVDGVMFMGISPGVLGTNSFPATVNRRLLMVQSANPNIKTFVDGSVNYNTLDLYKSSGAYTVVSGSSAMFKSHPETEGMTREELINFNINKIKGIIQ